MRNTHAAAKNPRTGIDSERTQLYSNCRAAAAILEGDSKIIMKIRSRCTGASHGELNSISDVNSRSVAPTAHDARRTRLVRPRDHPSDLSATHSAQYRLI